MKTVTILLVLFTTFMPLLAVAKNPSPEPFSFQRWKDQQVVEARNHVVRLTNRMHLLKTGRYKVDKETLPLLDEQDEKLYKELKVLGEDQNAERAGAEKLLLKSVEARMKMAIENLQIAKDLTIDDYIAVYLSAYSENTEALSRLVERLSKDEILNLLQARLRPISQGRDATVNPPSAGGIIQVQSESVDRELGEH